MPLENAYEFFVWRLLLAAILSLALGACSKEDSALPTQTETLKSAESSFKKLEAQAASGDAEAQSELGSKYLNGVGVTKNEQFLECR